MKHYETGVGTPLSKKDLKEQLHETKETPAKADNAGRSFGSMDLWNLQKRQKTGISMRRRLM